MASTAQLRSWWSAYRCTTSKYVRVAFPGPTGPTQWSLYVAGPSEALWRKFAEVMRTHNYLFRESAGGTYNCRKISGSNNYSLHAYAIAVDLNPSKNRYGQCGTNQPAAFRTDVLAITVDGQQAFTWGGDWRPCTSADPMHWQINVSPGTAAKYVYTGDDDMALKRGDTGRAVAEAQEAMILLWSYDLGDFTPFAGKSIYTGAAFHPGADGVYGSTMESSVVRFQKNVQLPQTGVLDALTHSYLIEGLYRIGGSGQQGPPGPPGPKGDKGDKGDPGPSPSSATFKY